MGSRDILFFGGNAIASLLLSIQIAIKIMLSTELNGSTPLNTEPTVHQSFQINPKMDKKVIKPVPTSRPNDYTIEKLLNSPSTSSSSFSPPTSTASISSSMVLNQLGKSQLPIDIIAQTLWLQHQHLQNKFTANVANNLTLFESNNTSLLSNSSSPILTQSPAQLRRYLLPQQRPNRGPRRQRTTFTHEQTLRLEMEYHVSEYITRGKRFQLAELLDLSENQIKIWFQNRRAKDKRIEKAIVEQQYRYLSSPPFHQHLNVSNCSTCNYTKQQFNNETQN